MGDFYKSGDIITLYGNYMIHLDVVNYDLVEKCPVFNARSNCEFYNSIQIRGIRGTNDTFIGNAKLISILYGE